MTHPDKGKIQLRRGSSTAWRLKNPILSEGEPTYETDTKRQKIGDGITPYNDLPYSTLGEAASVTYQDLEDHINAESPHPNYDSGGSLILLYENAKV